MSAIGRRMNHLKSQLFRIRNGPGAALLPASITRLHLEFAHKQDKGHAGSRKLWQEYLPSLKYHNPTIPMIVNRTRDQSVEPILTIYMHSSFGAAKEAASLKLDAPSATATKSPKTAITLVNDPWVLIASSTVGSSPAPTARGGETAVQMTLRGLLSHEIWRQFMLKTGAEKIEPSPEDVEEMARLAALEQESDYNRRLEKARQDAIAREKATLQKARQEADALKAD